MIFLGDCFIMAIKNRADVPSEHVSFNNANYIICYKNTSFMEVMTWTEDFCYTDNSTSWLSLERTWQQLIVILMR